MIKMRLEYYQTVPKCAMHLLALLLIVALSVLYAASGHADSSKSPCNGRAVHRDSGRPCRSGFLAGGRNTLALSLQDVDLPKLRNDLLDA